MNCQPGTNPQPYPQYYAFQLLSDPNFLGLTNGGYIASSATANPSGLLVTGFYSSTKDNILIINTGTTNYPALTVGIKNPGNLTSIIASVYTVNTSNPTIGTQQTTLMQNVSGGYQATIAIPAYSTVALSFPASAGQTISPSPIVTSLTPTPTLPSQSVFF